MCGPGQGGGGQQYTGDPNMPRTNTDDLMRDIYAGTYKGPQPYEPKSLQRPTTPPDSSPSVFGGSGQAPGGNAAPTTGAPFTGTVTAPGTPQNVNDALLTGFGLTGGAPRQRVPGGNPTFDSKSGRVVG